MSEWSARVCLCVCIDGEADTDRSEINYLNGTVDVNDLVDQTSAHSHCWLTSVLAKF